MSSSLRLAIGVCACITALAAIWFFVRLKEYRERRSHWEDQLKIKVRSKNG
jgi:hypothetical protein